MPEQTTELAVGTPVRYWPDQLPFLANLSHKAKIVALPNESEPDAYRLSVKHTTTGRTFFVYSEHSELPARKSFTLPEGAAPVAQPAPVAAFEEEL